jgi:hypothetical protein
MAHQHRSQSWPNALRCQPLDLGSYFCLDLLGDFISIK